MANSPARPAWKIRVVPTLVLVNCAIFGLETLLGPVAQRRLFDLFALSDRGLAEGHWWQLLTYAFLHAPVEFLYFNFWHLLMNMAGLWFAGRVVERMLRPKLFILLYALAAISGGVFQLLLGPQHMPLVGASGAVCGVILAFTTLFPEWEVMALVLFVIPIRLRAKFLGRIVVGSTLLFMLFHFEPRIGHAAHLGGCVAGYLFVRFLGRGNQTWPERWLFPRKPRLRA